MTREVDEFLTALSRMPGSYLSCRTIQHAWREDHLFTVVDSRREKVRRPRGGEVVFAERLLTCLRCGMERSDAYRITSTSGHTALQKIAATYLPPDGYYVKGAGRLAKDLVLGAKFERDLAAAAL